MPGSLPTWIEADKVSSHKGRWYIGSQSGLHIGPYADKDVAESKGLFVTKRLLRARSDGEVGSDQVDFSKSTARGSLPPVKASTLALLKVKARHGDMAGA